MKSSWWSTELAGLAVGLKGCEALMQTVFRQVMYLEYQEILPPTALSRWTLWRTIKYFLRAICLCHRGLWTYRDFIVRWLNVRRWISNFGFLRNQPHESRFDQPRKQNVKRPQLVPCHTTLPFHRRKLFHWQWEHTVLSCRRCNPGSP